MDTTTLNISLFLATALVAAGLAAWQLMRTKKSKERQERSALGHTNRPEPDLTRTSDTNTNANVTTK